MSGGIAYINCGDWAESCTAVVEHADGRMELVRWHDDTLLNFSKQENKLSEDRLPEPVLQNKSL